MKAYIQVVGQSSPEGPPTIIVHYDQQRYMFNCREGTQRLCVEEKVRMTKLRNIFLTRINWETMGGMPGMLLTLTDVGTKRLDLHGGKNLTHLMAAMRQFIYRTSNQVETHEIKSSLDTFDDGNLSVKPVPIFPTASATAMPTVSSSTSSVSSFNSAISNSEGEDSLANSMMSDASAGQKRAWEEDVVDPKTYLTRDRWLTDKGSWVKAKKVVKRRATVVGREIDHLYSGLPPTKPSQMVVSYICQGPTIPGKFNPKAAIGLGVKPGPAFGQLQKGIDIVLENGTVVTKSQVCEAEKDGHIFMIIDCPDSSYIDNLVTSPEFSPYQAIGGSHTPNVMIHLLGPQVLEDARYREWIKTFDSNTEHIISTQKICPQGVLYKSHALSQLKLAQLDPNVFPIPDYNNTPEQYLEECKFHVFGTTNLTYLAYNYHFLIYICAFFFRPKPFVFDHTDKNQPKIKDFFNDAACQESITLAKQEAAKVDLGGSFPGDDVEVITLGTGSAIPSKYRNVSATLVKIPDYGSLLLDAGEGTFGQMMRICGQNKLAEELNAVRAIFVSHLHADHHLGVSQLLTQWYKVDTSEQLVVVAPTTYERWLQEYNEIESFGLYKKVLYIRSEDILTNNISPLAQKNYEYLKESLGLMVMRPVEVFHCRYAYGLSVEHASGWKLVYSGDTRPCNRLVQAGKDCTLLIHEASFEDSMKEEAEVKRHSTTGEAVEVGNRMNARFTILNHFSQRYPKLPLLEGSHPNVFFSFDMMTVPIKQIPRLPKFTDAIQLFFKEVEKEEKEDSLGL
ncbi:beta-lactamase-like protein [Phycomyces blakesleeanus]|uniref:ribonuclease Z n=1 Tax=Phycomyces blakesleeanus TaxID=4837 RepID=A0ABR3AZN5_PHYBL